jgi:hypothetical protein
MNWMFIVVPAWLILAIGLALLIGRSVRQADVEATRTETDPRNFVVDRHPLTLAPSPPSETRPPPVRQPGSDAPTIPGLPSARPPVGPRAGSPQPRQKPRRRSDLG